MPSIRLCDVSFHRLPMMTRFPFRYGIASMTDVPHLFVVVTAEIDGRVARGMSADGLPPKWFTKNPDTTFEHDDLPLMLRVIRHASDIGMRAGSKENFFVWWRHLYETQHDWATENGIPKLLAGFGVSLIERAALDAVCRVGKRSLFQVLRENVLEIDFAALRPSLGSLKPRDVMPSMPAPQVTLRHTVGLGDPLSDDFADDPQSRLNHPQDGLPFTLAENIHAYKLRYFKIKLSGDLEVDQDRLTEIATVVNRTVGSIARFTLDGNENYRSIGQFREAWNHLRGSATLRDFMAQSLLFVEQPLHRTVALEPSVAAELRTWAEAPPIIIDESDASLESLPTALSLGYAGTSHKNCKGILKSLLGAATITHERRNDKPLILSAEDLGNVGPVALLQDLAMVAALGVSHVERNGHHYFAGLKMFTAEIQDEMLEHHADLYDRHDDGFAKLAPKDGMLSLKSVNNAPFGLRPLPRIDCFERWEF